MATIYHVEHGDTAFDAKDLAQGLMDAGLTDKGKRQAAAAGRALRGKGIDCVYCSPLKRAHQSANIVADSIGAKVIIRPKLRPLDIGDLAGKPESTVKKYLDFYTKRPTLTFPNGESFAKWYDQIRKEWIHQFGDDDPVIAVVSHSRDYALLKHWEKHGINAECDEIDFTEPVSAQVSKATKSGNSISVRKIQ